MTDATMLRERLAERLAPILGVEAVYIPGPCPDGHPNRERAIGEPCGMSLASVDDYLGIWNLTAEEVAARFAGKTCLKPVGRKPVNFLDPGRGFTLYETWARTCGAVLLDVTCRVAGCTLHLLTPRLTHPVTGAGGDLVTAIWVAVDRALLEGA